MADFKPINTQEEFDNAIKERIARTEKKIREEFNGYLSPDDVKALKTAHADALKKYEGYDEKFATQTARIHELEVGALKTKVALGKGLSLDAVEFLHGDDEKSINESADKLSKLSAPTPIGFTKNTEQGTETGLNAELRKLASQFGRE